MAIKTWPRVDDTQVHKIGWRTVVVKKFVDPSGKVVEYGTLHSEDARSAAIIALTKDYKVIIAEQFRTGPEKIYEELPGGMVDEAEHPRDAALRELAEETGYEVHGQIEELGKIRSDGYTNNTNHYFLGTDCRRTASQNLDEGEYVEPREISIEQLIANAKSDMMSDALGVFLGYERLRELIKERDKAAHSVVI